MVTELEEQQSDGLCTGNQTSLSGKGGSITERTFLTKINSICTHVWEGNFAERRLEGVLLHFVQQRSDYQLGVHT